MIMNVKTCASIIKKKYPEIIFRIRPLETGIKGIELELFSKNYEACNWVYALDFVKKEKECVVDEKTFEKFMCEVERNMQYTYIPDPKWQIDWTTGKVTPIKKLTQQ